MSREVRLGILAIFTIALAIWAYKYVKGKNLFKKTTTFYTVFDNVDQLTVASPVSINGYNIGTVLDIELNPENTKSIVVTLEVDGNIAYPKSTQALLMSAGVVGGKMIALEFDKRCSGPDCAKSGDTINGKAVGLIESMIGEEDIDQYSVAIKQSVGSAIDTILQTLSNKEIDSPINQSLHQMQITMENLAGVSKTMNSLMKSSYGDLTSTLSNMATLSNSLAESNQQIKNLLNNLDGISTEMRKVQITPTIEATNGAIAEATSLMQGLDSTITTSTEAFTELSTMLDKMSNGDGTLAKLMNDDQLYENIELSTQNLNLLLQDLRLNPRRYLRVFGKKSKEYVLPEDDPAFQRGN